MAEEWNRKEIQKEEDALYEKLKDRGIKIIELSDTDREKATRDEEIVRISYTPGLEELLKEVEKVQNN